MHIIDELKWRGLVYQISDEEKVREYLSTPGRRMYCGFDPTAKSLHIGNLVPLIALLRFKKAGFDPIYLAGGGTGRIGDPSGKDAERKMMTVEQIDSNIENIKKQVRKIFGSEVTLVNNNDWLSELSAIGLLRDVGKHFSVNMMMAKDSVKNRIGREETGISYTEFSYMILQSYDFYHLANEYDCMMQIGGSDQWGNITAGTEFIRRKLSKEGFALTFPLLTTADGKKFGKSEKGAIYLDPELTSVYDFYQYWVRVDDRDVLKLMRYYTFLTEEEINAYQKDLDEQPHLRLPQKRLAAEMTDLVHGKEEREKIEVASQALFGKGDIREVDVVTLQSALSEAPNINYASLDEVPDLPQILLDLGLTKSKGQGRKDIKAGGVYINNERVQDADFKPQSSDLIQDRAIFLRKGKKHYGLIMIG